MLQWLRRNPRLLLMSASTLASNISGTLAVLTPGLMLPADASDLLGRCPQLASRTPSGIQVCFGEGGYQRLQAVLLCLLVAVQCGGM